MSLYAIQMYDMIY